MGDGGAHGPMPRQARLVTADVDRPLRESAAFLAVTFGIAATVYLPLLASGRGWIGLSLPAELAAVGVMSPGLAVFALRGRAEGVAGLRALVAGLADWRFGRPWWAATLGLPPLYFAAVAVAYNAMGGAFAPDPVGLLVEAGPGVALIVGLTLVLAYAEEVGWRGYLLPRLQARTGALSASLLLGAIWLAWHVPLFVQTGTPDWSLPVRGVFIVAGAVVYTWLYNNTGGSVLAVTLLHAGFNTWGPLIGAHPMVTGDALSGYVLSGMNVVAALAVVVLFGRRTLADRRFAGVLE